MREEKVAMSLCCGLYKERSYFLVTIHLYVFIGIASVLRASYM